MGASPTVNIFLKKMFSDIDFDRERNAIGNIIVEDIDRLQHEYVKSLSEYLKILKYGLIAERNER